MIRKYSLMLAAVLIANVSSHGNLYAMSLGEFEYRNSCIQCHGDAGRGDGSLADLLKAPPADLTALQKNNGGVFPVARVHSIIEGSADVRLHGPRDMPLWGDRFRARLEDDDYGVPGDRQEYATTRILALIEYISTMQEK